MITVISYSGMAYVYYLIKPSLIMWDNLYYLGHVVCITAIILGMVLPKAKKKDTKKVTSEGDK